MEVGWSLEYCDTHARAHTHTHTNTHTHTRVHLQTNMVDASTKEQRPGDFITRL
jgi:hypothetical protein